MTGVFRLKFPLFVLIGHPFLCEEKRKVIIASLEKEFGSPLAVTLRQAGEAPVAEWILEARTLPFLVSAQVFSIRDADQFAKSDWNLWQEYFESPHSKSFFIFEAASFEKNPGVVEKAAQAKQVFLLKPQTESMVARFIQEKLKRSAKTMNPETQRLLEARVGDSFLFLDSLLDQLILCTGERSEITPADLEILDEKLIQLEGSDLLRSLAERNAPRALAALNDLLEANFRDFSSVSGLLHWQLRRLWEAKKWQAQGLGEREIAAKLRLSPARTTYFFRELKRFSLEELERILEGLFELDGQLKTGNAEGRYEIERWLISGIS